MPVAGGQSRAILQRPGPAPRRGQSPGDYGIAIFDEAHTLEDVAADHLGISVGRGAIEFLLNKLYHASRKRGLLVAYRSPEALKQVDAVRFAADDFFTAIRAWLARQPKANGRVRQPNIVADPLSEELKKLASQLVALSEPLKAEEEKIELTAAAARCESLALTLQQWLGQDLEGQVYWVETGGERTPRIALSSAPVEVGAALKQQLYSQVPTVILTSATLSVGGRVGFRHFQERLGLDDCDARQLGSPFDYREQVELHLFRQMPDPSADPSGFETEGFSPFSIHRKFAA